MAVLQFSFGDVTRKNERDPIQAWPKNRVVCTGTHDTPPLIAWLAALDLLGPNNGIDVDFDVVWNVLRRYTSDFDDTSFQEWTYSVKDEEKGKLLLSGLSEHEIPIRPEIQAIHLAALRAVMSSSGDVALFPMQDILGLAATARINYPGRQTGNWLWRVPEGGVNVSALEKLYALTKEFHR